MKQSFDEFLKEIKNVYGKRNHKIKNSIGVIDGFYYYRKNRPKDKDFVLKNTEYLSIIREMNLLLVDNLIENRKFKLPCGFGDIEIVKTESKSWINKDEKLETTKPINMHETLKLWYEDEESRLNKTYVRYDNDYTFRIKYIKKTCSYRNNIYFNIKFGRFLKKKLKDAIVESDYDAYELKNIKYEYSDKVD